jgi:hypothetical protein
MTAGQLEATGLEPASANARVPRRAAILSAVVIVTLAVAIAVPLLVVKSPQPAVVPGAAPASVVPVAPPTVAAPAPGLVLPSVFGPVRQDRLPDPGGPGLRCPDRLRGLCAY